MKTTVPIININLDLSPRQRWQMAAHYSQEINEIIACYWIDIEDYVELLEEYLEAYKAQFIAPEFLEEIEGLAEHCAYTADQILMANLYYDIVKFAFACTAFAVEAEGTVWHGRNLDWWTENEVLKKYTKLFNFTRGGKTVFQSVGWMGFVGVLSGMQPQAFSVTLNAIVSEEAPNIGKPVAFLLREVLQEPYSFGDAQKLLEETPLISDCLLLLAGTQASEICVIERTPTQYSTRIATNNSIVVTNDYKSLEVNSDNQNVLRDTSCGRYDQAQLLLKQKTPKDATACFAILDNEQVKMNITVQQMVFNARLGEVFC